MQDLQDASFSSDIEVALPTTRVVMPGTRRTTIGEFPELPIGFRRSHGGTPSRAVAFKRWRAADELEVGKLVAQKQGVLSMIRFTAEVLALFLTELGDLPWSGLKPTEKIATLLGLPSADFLTAWVLLRIQAMGPEMQLDLECANRACEAKVPYRIALNTLETVVAEEDSALQHEVRLADGFEWRGKVVPGFLLGPIRTSAFDLSVKERKNPAAIKLAMLRASIIGLLGEPPAAVTGDELASGLSKRDLEMALAGVADILLGPDLEIDLRCPECDLRINRSISWDYAGFFSATASSRSGAPTP